MTNSQLFSQRGFAIFGVAIALAILGSMAMALSSLIAANQRTKVRQSLLNQAFYISHASLEYSLRNIQALNASSIPERQLLGTNFKVSTSNKIRATTNYGHNENIAANAVSIRNPSYAPSCIYVLASSGSNSLNLNGTADVDASTCGIHVNSSSASALRMVGNASLKAHFIDIAGNYSIGGNNTITTQNGHINTGTSVTPDPLNYLDMKSYSSCDHNNFSVSDTATLNPGVYCNGLSITGNGTVTLSPGDYVIDGGTLSATGSASVVAHNVTIFLNKQLANSYATVSLTGSGQRIISAPSSGTYAGVAIYQSKHAPNGSNTITGSGSLDVTGAIYLPNQSLSYGGTSSSARCTLLIVNSLSISGTANLGCTAGDLSGIIP